jgi:hypothetical protein
MDAPPSSVMNSRRFILSSEPRMANDVDFDLFTGKAL